jgi:putative membrane protein
MPLFGKPKRIPTSRIYPLQYRKIWKKLILLELSSTPDGQKLWRSVFLSLLTLGGVYAVVGFLVPTANEMNWTAYLAPLIGMWGALIFFAILYQWLYIWTYFYDIGDVFLRIRKGVLIRREMTIPYGRIQDINVDQDVMDHIFHLYDVHVETATLDSGTEAHIDGLNAVNAATIRDLILGHVEAAAQSSQSGGL